MITNRIRAKIDYLRKQPEQVRLRAATTWTAIAGSIIALLWITVILPLEIKMNRSDSKENLSANKILPLPTQPVPTTSPESAVAGVRVTPTLPPLSTVSPVNSSPTPSSAPVASVSPTSSPSQDPEFIPVSTPQ